MAEFGPTSIAPSEIKYNMYNHSNSSTFATDVEYNTYNNLNWTDIGNFQFANIPNFTEIIVFSVILFTLCFLGLVGNGKVIWILGFHMKTNSFSIYVLNLAVADSGVLIMQALMQISQILSPNNFRIDFIFLLLYFVLYNTSQLLLISISVDRCVSVLFPIWHQCHRPPKLSLLVCVITWVLPFVYFALEMVITFSEPFLLFQLIFNGLISYPLVVISSLILFVKIFLKQRQLKRKKVLMVTLLSLMGFIVFSLPLSILSIITYSILKNNDLNSLVDALLANSLIEIKLMVDFILTNAHNVLPWIQHIIILALLSNICNAVNSSINPILYFLAGRNKEDRSRVSMKLVLQRVFKNEEDTKEDGTQPNESQL
ncbi:mas-related G-protein coupled receptor member H-like [Protobothrops mucrosquamatus]|uniref:mas-related G-protein coupled receptor member H-like n=1 Tax=Protobothrops mucrosquamatus TaxID=103944 RepID=UPI0010FAE8C5|nr:mas-related G-protein coupled receptor member H-like [Protobothrops mucrosquamatus]